MTAELTLTTPGLLFPATSLLLLAYTNRYLALANIIRQLFEDYKHSRNHKIIDQIGNLRARIRLIKWMQAAGVGSLFLTVVSMFQLYLGWGGLAQVFFGISLVLMIVSLGVSLIELMKSTEALNILLSHLEAEQKAN
jgi:hypothetical protein